MHFGLQRKIILCNTNGWSYWIIWENHGEYKHIWKPRAKRQIPICFRPGDEKKAETLAELLVSWEYAEMLRMQCITSPIWYPFIHVFTSIYNYRCILYSSVYIYIYTYFIIVAIYCLYMYYSCIVVFIYHWVFPILEKRRARSTFHRPWMFSGTSLAKGRFRSAERGPGNEEMTIPEALNEPW